MSKPKYSNLQTFITWVKREKGRKRKPVDRRDSLSKAKLISVERKVSVNTENHDLPTNKSGTGFKTMTVIIKKKNKGTVRGKKEEREKKESSLANWAHRFS